ncbi:MAG: PDZ domain-containing protein [Planctomycetota bacterium]
MQLARLVPCVALVLGGLAHAAPPGDRDWDAITGPSQGERPEPWPEVEWREDLGKALRVAKEEGRPLFVTVRCLPCKQCADFDRDVLEGGPELDPLLRQFVTVRLTDMSQVDRRILPFDGFQDLDLSWWGYLLSPEGRLYGVYGGKDHTGDASRISVPGLAATLERVLAHHCDPRRPAWDIDGEAPKLRGRAETPERLKGFARWKRESPDEVRAQSCLHCHQVSDVLRQPAIEAGAFDKRSDFFVWPYPENLGLTLDRDDGLLVREVEAESPAAQAGLRPGDALVAAEERKLFSQTDLRGVLHRLEGDAVTLRWRREGALQSATLELAPGWRASDLGWRKSVAEARIGGAAGIPWPLATNPGERRARGLPEGAMAIKPWWGPAAKERPAVKAGLRPGEWIVAVDGESPDLHGRAFNAWFRLRYEPKQRFTLTLVDPQGGRRELELVAQ